jgi:hypothetical protein
MESGIRNTLPRGTYSVKLTLVKFSWMIIIILTTCSMVTTKRLGAMATTEIRTLKGIAMK